MIFKLIENKVIYVFNTVLMYNIRRYFIVQNNNEDNAQVVAVGQLRSFIERIERLEEEKKTLSDDIKEVYAEVKGSGFDVKAVRTVVRMRKKEDHERQEEESMIQLYKDALGMN